MKKDFEEKFVEITPEEAWDLMHNNELCSIVSPMNYGLPNAVIPNLPKEGEIGFINLTQGGKTIRARYICKHWKSKGSDFKKEFPSLTKRIWKFKVKDALISNHNEKLKKEEKFIRVEDFKGKCIDKQNIHKIPDGDFIILVPNATEMEIDRLKDVISRVRKSKGKVILIAREGIKIKEVLDKQRVNDALVRFWSRATKDKNHPFYIKLDEAMDDLKKELKL